MEMGERIKQRRKELGLTLEDVGKAVGVSKSTVRKWETGFIANMRRDKIPKLASVLQTTPAELMGWETPEPPVASDYRIPDPSEHRDVPDRSERNEAQEKTMAAFYDYLAAQIAEAEKFDKGLIEFYYLLGEPLQKIMSNFSDVNEDLSQTGLGFISEEDLASRILRMESRKPEDRVYWLPRKRKIELRKEKEKKGFDFLLWILIEKIEKLPETDKQKLLSYIDGLKA